MGKWVEPKRTGEFILHEAHGTRSRDTVTVTGSEFVGACTVLGEVTDNGLFKKLDLDASDGSEKAAGILYATVDATDEDAIAVAFVRDAEIITDDLLWPEGITEAQIASQLINLKSLGLIAR